VGRPSAQASLRAFLDAVTEAPAALVEANLARVYHKLDIKSRAELGRRIATLET